MKINQQKKKQKTKQNKKQNKKKNKKNTKKNENKQKNTRHKTKKMQVDNVIKKSPQNISSLRFEQRLQNVKSINWSINQSNLGQKWTKIGQK